MDRITVQVLLSIAVRWEGVRFFPGAIHGQASRACLVCPASPLARRCSSLFAAKWYRKSSFDFLRLSAPHTYEYALGVQAFGWDAMLLE